MNSNPFSSAYALASSYSTVLLVPKSDLLPASAITISGLAYNGKYDFKIPRSLHLTTISLNLSKDYIDN